MQARQILRDSLPAGMGWFGALPRDPQMTLPSRHLGLVQAEELADLDARLDAAADALERSADTRLPAPVSLRCEPSPPMPALLSGVRIGIAQDAAFAFLYPANVQLLRDLGADIRFFSPLHDQQLPEVDSLYLPGGYPELHLPQLSANQPLLEHIRAHHRAGKPILAEGGGLLYVCESLTDVAGVCAQLVGLLPAQAQMHPRFTALAMQEVVLPEGTLRGHAFHHSTIEYAAEPLVWGECPNYKRTAERVWREGRLTASYIQLYLPSNPQAAAALFSHD